MMDCTFWIAKKFLLSRKETGLISWNGIISIIGISVGVFALIITVAVLSGFETAVQDRIRGFESDLKLSSEEWGNVDLEEVKNELNHHPFIKGFTPFIERKGLILSGDDHRLVRVKSVNFSQIDNVYHLNIDFDPKTDFRENNLFIGAGITGRLNLSKGDTIRLMNPLGSHVYLGFTPITKCIVAGIFKTDIPDFDDNFALIPYQLGSQVFNTNQMDGFDVKLTARIAEHEAVKELTRLLHNQVQVSTWIESHQTLLAAMKMEKVGSTVVLCLIVLLASFNLMSTVVMLIIEKVKEIGILRTLGISKTGIRKIMAKIGFIIGASGIFSGLILGLGLVTLQNKFELIKLPGTVYFLDILPMELHLFDCIIIVIISIILIGLSVIYPGKFASELNPSKAVYFEK
tara:strand:- start:15813 stop:17018 length:1206 start_codon:yes stop_codon:yes gene_type:complete